MEPFATLTSTCVVLAVDNIDTDQIIPARFLKTTERRGLGAHLFADWRYDEQGRPRADFALNTPEARGAAILVTGRNFGCGSSREHAPWALFDFGFRAVMSTEFADIFRNNALKNGLLPVTLTPAAHEHLLTLLTTSPETRLTIDVATQTVSLPGGDAEHFPIDPFAKHCLLHGVDQLGFLLQQEAAISAYERTHRSGVCTR
ncbi:MAG: 3-isopropylmalate dehydratase small subunit [Gemmatimonadota bacterium]|nr:3-isopropylmalate dehydratase small subunit [Gemmatimonadota bacterium]